MDWENLEKELYNYLTFRCPHCHNFIDKKVDDYYRKKYNKQIKFMEIRIRNLRKQLSKYE
jgi:hypothetical protein